MTTIIIDILNPKAKKLLKNLADLELISIRESSEDRFSKILNKLRSKADSSPSFEEITKEVELVRSRRHGSKKV